MPRFDVVGIGTAAIDYLTVVERFPKVDSKVRSKDLVVTGGGAVGTALVALARLGQRVAFAGSVGEDDFGRLILAGLEAEAVDTSLAQIVAGARSPFAFCVATPPHRTVFSIRPTTPPLTIRPAELEAILDTQFVHLDDTQGRAAVTVAREARKRNVGVSLDLQRSSETAEELLACADVAVVSESFARERFANRGSGEAVAELYRPHMQLAAITLGDRGCIAKAADGVFEVPAEQVEVVDSTGAGDAFHGALLVGLLSGHSPRRAVALATHVAAMSCTGLGGRAALPRRDELGAEWL